MRWLRRFPCRLDSEAAAKADLGRTPRNRRRRSRRQRSRSSASLSENKGKRMPPVYSGLKLTDAGNRNAAHTGSRRAPNGKSTGPSSHRAVRRCRKLNTPHGRAIRSTHFVLARLEREGLEPSPEASRETLLRRVTLDLTGAAATPAEIDAFLSDHSPNAYEKVVDRLLASPRYGERMAARWLDAARYADTNGYQYDGERVMWRWRDWVIDAFNRNQPFDQFTLEQIAGDMLPNATLEQKIATGFNRNHRANTEDGIIPEEYAVEYVVDRVETTSTVFMGLTLGCARCHNHKYDPFTQKEFYQFFAYFNNVPELGRAMKYGNSPPMVAAPTAEQQTAARTHWNRRLRPVQSFLREHDAANSRAQAWESELQTRRQRGGRHRAASILVPMDGAAEAKAPAARSYTSPGTSATPQSFDGKAYLDGGQRGRLSTSTTASPFLPGSTPNPTPRRQRSLPRWSDNPKGKG